MPASDIALPLPLTRLNPWYPGQFGVPGTSNKTGLRQTCEGAVFYVDPNAVGVNDLRDGTDTEAPLATVAAALALCEPYRGDTILVMASNAWQYNDPAEGRATAVNEAVTVTCPGVRIVGVCPSSSIGVPWTVPNAHDYAITVLATDVTIEGFVFTGALDMGGIYARWNGVAEWGDGLTVRHCFFDDPVETAINLEFAYYCDIHHNVFQDVQDYGVYSDPAKSASAFGYIHDNLFNDVGTTAIELDEGTHWDIHHNRFWNAAAAGGGAAPDCYINLDNGSNNLVSENVQACILPLAGVGDWDDCNSAGASDAWVHNMLLDGVAVTNPT